MTSLETPRLLLRPPTENDFDALYRIWTEPDVRRFLWDGEIISGETAREDINASIQLFQLHGFGIWSVIDKSTDELIGFCGFRFVSDTGDIELLYGVRSPDWGKGLTTEAVRAAIDYLFNRGDIQRIVAYTDVGNVASYRVLEKLGMQRQGQEANGLVCYELERPGMP